MGGGDEVSGETHYLSLVSVVSETPMVKSRSQQGGEGGVRTSMDPRLRESHRQENMGPLTICWRVTLRTASILPVGNSETARSWLSSSAPDFVTHGSLSSVSTEIF